MISSSARGFSFAGTDHALVVEIGCNIEEPHHRIYQLGKAGIRGIALDEPLGVGTTLARSPAALMK